MPTTNRPFFANFFAAFRAHSALQKAPPAITSPQTTATITSAAAAYGTLSSLTYHTTSSPDTSSSPTSSTSQIPIKSPSPYTSTHSPHSSPNNPVTTSPPQSHFRSSRPLHPHAPNGTPQSRGRMRSTSREAPVYGSPTQAQSYASTAAAPPYPSRTPSPGPATASYPLPHQYPRQRRGSDSSAHSGSSGLASPSNGSYPSAGALATSPQGNAKEKWYIGGRTAQGGEVFYQLKNVRTQGSADRLSLDRLSL